MKMLQGSGLTQFYSLRPRRRESGCEIALWNKKLKTPLGYETAIPALASRECWHSVEAGVSLVRTRGRNWHLPAHLNCIKKES